MEITSVELKQKIENGEKVLVDFHGVWCGPCKIMKPIFEKIANQMVEEGSKIQMYTMDVDHNREYAGEIGLRSIPTIKGFSNGKEILSEVGAKQRDAILEMVEKLN
jgi:thioredoxin 1